ncbi:hypothetical protein [Streptomyces sp. HUAS TT7]
MDQAFEHSLTAVYVVIALGTLHFVVQIVRHDREQRRVRAAEQDYLASAD